MAPPTPTRPLRRRVSGLSLVFWLALIPLLALSGWFALRACALTWPGGAPVFFFCPEDATAGPRAGELERARIRGLTLEERLERLRLALADAPACPVPPGADPPEVALLPERPEAAVPEDGAIVEAVPDGAAPEDEAPVEEPPVPEPPVPEPPVPEPPVEAPIEEPPSPEMPPEEETAEDPPPVEPEPPPVEDAAEEEPPVPEPPLDEEPPAVPEPPETTPQPPEPPDAEAGEADDDLPVPEDGLDERDLSMLEGCWNLASDYRITSPATGESAATESWQMCFDDRGRGTQTLAFENGVNCEGRVQAQFEPDGSLRIVDLGNVPCDNGLSIVQRVVECSREGGSVDCTTRHVTPPAFPVPVRFER
jgi:hypothetical protein